MEFIYSPNAIKQFKKLDKSIQKKIKTYTDELETLQNPRTKGKGLVANLSGYWRYRVENYRLICKIVDNEMIILCLEIDKRDKIYK
ncbi:type II toxin-antitoxin system RelE family toxin [Campylobacter mucosalis]|uniref:type II toxin-antitoxin system RelE family toxin n=1 Tax=Campylobacter mucosalis TaxID=202 RepID=UPI0014702146|nr:type II toxin-antitoxin system RelE/ParE family toxin [Campylobacter mucosalis]